MKAIELLKLIEQDKIKEGSLYRVIFNKETATALIIYKNETLEIYETKKDMFEIYNLKSILEAEFRELKESDTSVEEYKEIEELTGTINLHFNKKACNENLTTIINSISNIANKTNELVKAVNKLEADNRKKV